ncbi:phenylalanine--tRNA ligase subunit alpha [bacterium]|nr:phenylalanine--tRNA ligase subunit alpha [bacterium]
MDLKSLKIKAQEKIQKTKELKDLDSLWREYIGKKGKISKIFNALKDLSEEERRKIGKQANEIKEQIRHLIEEKRKELLEKETSKQEMESGIDVTLPGKKIEGGHLHPLTQVLERIEEIFGKMGFSIVEGPDIENEWYNFDALNIPKDHPARDLWDTLWLKIPKLLLRTHTSPVQIHYMEKNNPPFRIVVPGRVFRYEATDFSHEIQFYQLEGLMVDKDISLANLKAILIQFFKNFFGREVKIRFRPGYFPFTEPSIEADIRLNRKWMEVLGAGMVHPNVFKAARLNPHNWQGFAFGMGVDRLAMLKYKINDIRLFYNGDLRFLEQF